MLILNLKFFEFSKSKMPNIIINENINNNKKYSLSIWKVEEYYVFNYKK